MDEDDKNDKKISVFLLTNVASPYRLPIFERLSKLFELDVYYCEEEKSHRKWDTESREYNFDSNNVSNITIGPIVINYAIILALIKEKYDVFVVGDNRNHVFATMLTFLFAKATGRPFVLWTGQTDYTLNKCSDSKSTYERLFKTGVAVVSELYQRILYIGADAFIAYSSNTREHLCTRGVSRDQIFTGGQVMPEECLASKPKNRRNSKNQADNTFTITFLGYLQERKGVQLLIEAFNSLNLPRTQLQIAGTGTYQQQLEELAAGNTRIEFLGYVENESKAKCYAESDLFVLPTLQDPWGLVINEAVHYNCPVIVTEAAGSSDLVKEEDCGIVVSPGDVKALRQAIQDLYHDNERRESYIKNAKENSKSTNVDVGIQPFHKAIMTSVTDK